MPWSPSCLNKAHLGQWFCYQPPCLILTLLNASKEKRSPCLKNLLKHLLELNILSTKQCDVITTEFKKFLDVEVKTVKRIGHIFSEGRSVRLFLSQSCKYFKMQRFVVCR